MSTFGLNEKLLKCHWERRGKKEGRIGCRNNVSISKLKSTIECISSFKSGLVITTHGNNNFYAKQCIQTFKHFFLYDAYIILYLNECIDNESMIEFCHNTGVECVVISNQVKFGGLTGTWNDGIKKCVENGCTVISLCNDDVFFNSSINHIFTTCHLNNSNLKYYGPLSNKPGPGSDNTDQLWPPKIKCKEAPYEINDNLNGFFLVFSISSLELNKFSNLYYFNPDYPFGGNEVDWHRRFVHKGGIGVVVPQTFVYHYKLKTWRELTFFNTHCLYTINVGNYDSTISQTIKNVPSDVDFFCVTDDENAVEKMVGLNILPIFVIKDINVSFVLMQRLIKALPHKYLPCTYKTSVYIDANVYIDKKIIEQISYDVITGSRDIISFDHPLRNTVHEEAKIVISEKLEKVENVSKIFSLFIKDNFNDNVGLSETCVLVRRHEPLIHFAEEWASLLSICFRDQIMFDYLCWKYKLNIYKHFSLRKMGFNKISHNGSGSVRRLLN
jgi:hypothetical protein